MKMEHTAQKNNEEWCNTVNTESCYGQEEWFAPNMTKLVEEWCTLYNLHEEQCTIKQGGSLSSGTKMAMKIFVKHVFTIFATNASFLRVIAILQI